ncbi:delay of germination protein [Tasmannia lanceolata]|uniref:delay of germination protein n=1 Tax=Tasmannia lanceolata TaxID=3420 RepID=UPI00406314D5
MAPSVQDHRFRMCYENWLDQQQQDLNELLIARNTNPQNEEELSRLVSKTMQHYQDYIDKRTRLSHEDPPCFFAPKWCSSLENSFMWNAGCRPSIAIRLLYSLCGSEMEAQLVEYLQGVRKGNLAELSPRQMGLVNELRGKTVREEEKISERRASLEEGVADDPLDMMASERGQGWSEDDVDRAIDAQAEPLRFLLEDADKLRVSTLREIIDILTPLQAADLLIAAKQLHLSFHEWGVRRDNQHERP